MLKDEKFIAHWNKNQDVRALIDFVKAEVRKQDDALIRELLDALEESRFDALNMTMAGMQRQSAAIAAAHARLGEGGGV